MSDDEDLSLKQLADRITQRYGNSTPERSVSPERNTPPGTSEFNPVTTPDDTPPKTENSKLVPNDSGRNLMNDFNKLDALKQQLTQCQADLEECEQSKFSNKAKNCSLVEEQV